MSTIRTAWRFFVVVVMFLYAGIELRITSPKTRTDRAAWLSRFCARVLRAMDVTWTTSGPVPTSGAVLANHLSFLDMLIHSALRPCVFVSKIELRSTPLLGWMSMMSGTVYVVRGGGGSGRRRFEGMAEGFRDGLPVIFFPEGTTSLGDEPTMPFRSGLISKSIEAGAPITASFIRYQLSPRDLAEGKTLRHDLHWGEVPLAAQAWRFLALHNVSAHVRFADAPIAFSEKALHNRKQAALESREAVVSLGLPNVDTESRIDSNPPCVSPIVSRPGAIPSPPDIATITRCSNTYFQHRC